jgi:hypothetical protein
MTQQDHTDKVKPRVLTDDDRQAIMRNFRSSRQAVRVVSMGVTRAPASPFPSTPLSLVIQLRVIW